MYTIVASDGTEAKVNDYFALVRFFFENYDVILDEDEEEINAMVARGGGMGIEVRGEFLHVLNETTADPLSDDPIL